MSRVAINDLHLTNIANAIRDKKSVSDTYRPDQMADAIMTITSPSESQNAYATTVDQTILPSAGKLLSKVELSKISQTNLSADNIINGVTININNGNTDIYSVQGTADYVKTVSSVPSAKATNIIYNSTDGKFYIWK